MADDDRDDYVILQQAALKIENPLTITYAANWIELLRLLVKTEPDILFLDLNMPVKDGFECLESLRADKRFIKLPIIIYSTSLSKIDIDKAHQKGANYFVVKPHAIQDISNMLSKVTSMSKEDLTATVSREKFVIL